MRKIKTYLPDLIHLGREINKLSIVNDLVRELIEVTPERESQLIKQISQDILAEHMSGQASVAKHSPCNE